MSSSKEGAHAATKRMTLTTSKIQPTQEDGQGDNLIQSGKESIQKKSDKKLHSWMVDDEERDYLSQPSKKLPLHQLM